MTYEEFRKLFPSSEEINEKSRKSDSLKKISRAILEMENNVIVDEVELKRNRDWAELSNQVVGAENF